jgi:hypothetical protein
MRRAVIDGVAQRRVGAHKPCSLRGAAVRGGGWAVAREAFIAIDNST